MVMEGDGASNGWWDGGRDAVMSAPSHSAKLPKRQK